MTAALGVTFVVENEQVLAMLARVETGLSRIVGLVAEALALDAASEAGQVSTRLGQPWPVSGTSPVERHVEAPEWWAHFLAGGTRSHGPTSAPQLAFEVDGNMVFASYVSGISADHFDERAVEQTKGRVDDIIRLVLLESGA
jgi:hypothetical protein